MNKISLAAAVALASALPLAAQQTTPPDHATPGTHAMNPDQQRDYDSWPPDRRTMYDRWPNNLQVYYWTLDPVQRNGWWVLNDEQRAQIYAMTPEQQVQTWASIDQQLRGTAPAAATSSAARGTAGSPASPTGMAASSGNIQWTSNAVVQQVPPPHRGEYPVCKGDNDDQCMNPWEAGMRGPNVDRPLAYWPGKPASAPGNR